MRGLQDRVALVTGAAAGIGRATAIRLAEEGCKVCVADINGGGAEEVALRIQSSGGEAFAFTADVADVSQCQAMVEATVDRLGSLDILVNNAGMPARNQSGEPNDIWDRGIDITLSSVYRITELAIPHLERGQHPAVINISSVIGNYTFGLAEWYAAAKAGLTGLTRAHAGLHGDKGIRINAICFGFIKTDRNKMSWDDPNMAARIALRRLAEPEEAASAIAFLASDDASYISGEVMTVDGGFNIT